MLQCELDHSYTCYFTVHVNHSSFEGIWNDREKVLNNLNAASVRMEMYHWAMLSAPNNTVDFEVRKKSVQNANFDWRSVFGNIFFVGQRKSWKPTTDLCSIDFIFILRRNSLLGCHVKKSLQILLLSPIVYRNRNHDYNFLICAWHEMCSFCTRMSQTLCQS